MEKKILYMIIILILMVIVVADIIFMFQGLTPSKYTSPPSPQTEERREAVTGPNVGAAISQIDETLKDASNILDDISNKLK